jgi:hypothetical protein
VKYLVISACYNVNAMPPAPVKMNPGVGMEGSNDLLAASIVDTEDNVLAAHCENVHDVEDFILEFWNRLNPSSKDGPDYTHDPYSKVVVVHVRPAAPAEIELYA